MMKIAMIDFKVSSFSDISDFYNEGLSEAGKNLYVTVVQFYEACKITAKYDQLNAILANIKISYEICTRNNSDQELSLWVKNEFSSVMQYINTDLAIGAIVKWCLNHELLQQAVTMTAEWLPRYLLAEHILHDADEVIVGECEKQRQPWDSWSGYFFKTYAPYERPEALETELIELNVKTLRMLIETRNYDLLDIFKEIKGRNILLDKFIQNVLQFCLTSPGTQFPFAVFRLPVNNPIAVIFKEFYKSSGDAYMNAIKRGMKGKKPTELIMYALSKISSEKIAVMFSLPLDNKLRTAKSDDDVESKIQYRQYIFSRLIDEKRISVPDKDLFLYMTDKYLRVIEFYRNRMNHGVILYNEQQGNAQIAATVREVLDIVDKLKCFKVNAN